MKIKVSIVVPIDFSQRPQQFLQRALCLAKEASCDVDEIVFAVKCSEEIFRKVSELKNFGNILIVRDDSDGFINLSRLRNLGIKAANNDFLLNLDVDIYWDVKLFKDFLNNGLRENLVIDMLPCLYTTNSGYRSISKRKNAEKLIDDYFSFSRKYAIHLAIPSSVILFRKELALKISGFDEAYEGYGYEDLDFILRYKRKFSEMDELGNEDCPSLAPLLQRGFRAELAMLSLKNLVSKRIAIHLFHPRIKSQYLNLKKNNKNYFLDKFKQECGLGIYYSFPLIDALVRECAESQSNFENFHVLFDARPRHLNRLDSFFKKIRYIFE